MNLDTATELVTIIKEFFPSAKNDIDNTVDGWMGLFGDKEDAVMRRAIALCLERYKFWPSPAEIFESIRTVQYQKQTQPKLIPWEVKRDTRISNMALEMVASGRVDEYRSKVDITKLYAYAKTIDTEVSEEMVRKNYAEFESGYKSVLQCGACRTGRRNCMSGGFVTKLRIDGEYVKTEMAQCLKKN